MSLMTSALLDFFRDHHGVIGEAEFGPLEVSRSQRDHMVAAGLIVPLHRGTWRLRSAPVTLEGRSRAICLAEIQAVITGRAGGRLWGLRRMGAADEIAVRVPHHHNDLADRSVILRRCNAMDPADVVERTDGIRVVSPPRLAFDLATDLSELDLESAVEQILDREWCTIQTIHEVGRRLYHPARPGSARFARVIGSRSAWLQPVDSHLELRLHDALRRAGIVGITRQHEIPLPGGWRIHADLAVPSLQWAIPVDHVTWHGGRADAQRDKQNDRQARMLGWQVDRVTDDDIDHRLMQTVAELLVIHRRLVAGSRALAS